jgi:hypothetical protein
MPLGDAQIKNLTDRLGALISSGAASGKTVQAGTYTCVSSTVYSQMSDVLNIAVAGRAGREWRVESSGQGNFGGAAGSFIFLVGGLPNNAQLQVQFTSAGLTNPTQFDWRATVIVTAKTATQLSVHLSVVCCGHATPQQGQAAERDDVLSGVVGPTTAFIQMVNSGNTGSCSAYRGVSESYGGS